MSGLKINNGYLLQDGVNIRNQFGTRMDFFVSSTQYIANHQIFNYKQNKYEIQQCTTFSQRLSQML